LIYAGVTALANALPAALLLPAVLHIMRRGVIEREAPPGAQVRRRVPELQGPGRAVGMSAVTSGLPAGVTARTVEEFRRIVFGFVEEHERGIAS
jgi:hypothetical protein